MTDKLSLDPTKISLHNFLCLAAEWENLDSKSLSDEQLAAINLKRTIEKNGQGGEKAKKPFMFAVQRDKGAKVPEQLEKWESACAKDLGVETSGEATPSYCPNADDCKD